MPTTQNDPKFHITLLSARCHDIPFGEEQVVSKVVSVFFLFFVAFVC